MQATLPPSSPAATGLLLTLLVLLALAPRPAAAQAPDWTRATLTGGGRVRVSVSAADASGNVYIAGAVVDTVTFGATTLIADALDDGFVAKWSPVTGQFAWVKLISGIDGDFVTALAVRDSSVYVAGISNSGTVYVDSLSTSVYNLAGSGSFLLKLHDRGTHGAVAWLSALESLSSIDALVASDTGAIYAAGEFHGILRLDGKMLLRDNVSLYGGNMFVMKLTDNGSAPALTWAQQAGGDQDDEASALAVVGTSVYVAGSFASSQVAFGATTLTNPDLTVTRHNRNVFVTKLTDTGTAGNFVWARQAGSPGEDEASALAVVGPNVYLGGTFAGPAITFDTQALSSAGGTDGFIARLTDAGPSAYFQWALAVGGPADDKLQGLVAAGSHLYAAGSFGSTATFGGPAVAATSQGLTDAFVAHVLDAGASARVAWVQTAGGTQADEATTLVVSPATGRLYAAGAVGSAPSFGALRPTPAAAYRAAFVAELGPVETTGTVPVVAPPAPPPAPPPAGPTPPPVASLAPVLVPYPSPAHGTTSVVLPAGPPGSPVALTVFDMLGQVVARASATLAATAAPVAVDLGGLAPGVYALRITLGDTTTTPRLVVE